MASSDGPSKDDIIRLNLEAFLPYICSSIQLADILSMIPEYTKEQRKQLFTESRQNNTKACKMALDLLLNKFSDPGRFVAFRDAMEVRDFPVIVKLLEGECVPFNENCQKIIDLFTSTFISNLNPEGILPYLVHEGTLNSRDAEKVRAESQNHGQQRACWLLLFYLPNRVENWFRNFMDALIDANYHELAETLEPDMYEKIMIQRNDRRNLLRRSEEADVKSDNSEEDSEVNAINKEEFETDPDQEKNNGVIISKGDYCAEPGDAKGDLCELPTGFDSMRLDTKETESNLTGDKLGIEGALLNVETDDSTTQLKELSRIKSEDTGLKMTCGNNEERKVKGTTCIQYDKQFLLSLRESPLSKLNPYWREIEQIRDIVPMKTIPRKLDSRAKSRSPIKDQNNMESYVRSVDTMPYRELVTDTSVTPNDGNVAPSDGKVALKDGNVALKDDNVALKDGNVALKDDNVALKDGNVALKDDNVALKDGNVALKDDNVAHNDGNVALKDGNVALKDDNVALKDGNVALKDDNVAHNNGSMAHSDSVHEIYANNFESDITANEDTVEYVGNLAEAVDETFREGMVSMDTPSSGNLDLDLDNTSVANDEDNDQSEELLTFDFLLDDNGPGNVDHSVNGMDAVHEPEDMVIDMVNGVDGEDKITNTNGPVPLAIPEIADLDLANTDGPVPNGVQDGNEEELLGAVGGLSVNIEPDLILYRALSPFHLNDLNQIINRLYNDDEDPYAEFNIPTDSDDIDKEDIDVDLREYQKELAADGCAGDNVIVMAPTNTGKTRVAFKIIQEHLRTQRKDQKIGRAIFLVENEALALQQGKECAATLPAYRTKIITGSLQRDKKQCLKDYLNRRDILIVTAQVLLNALINDEIPSLTIFSMIIFDECHHTNNNHRYNEIMSRYMDLKLADDPNIDNLPQIVGLTASVGVGGNVNPDTALKHMKEILANLDAKHLCTVRRNIEELRRYENNPREEIVTAHKRLHDPYRMAILQIMADIDQYMINHRVMETIPRNDAFIKAVCRVPITAGGTQQFQQWLAGFVKGIGRVRSSDVCSLLNPCREHLEKYNQALMIHADARRKDAESILETFMTYQVVINSESETEVMLLGLYDGLKQMDFSREPENPKLIQLQRIIWEIHGNNEEARGIIFVKTRELADALTHWVNETPQISRLNATPFVGQVAAAERGGTTKSKQRDALELFKNGRHKIVIATSVAEEGLDITQCNLVIRYEHVTNEIVRLQSRGRARAKDSRYYVVTEEGSWIVAKEEKNADLERLMNRLVPQLQVYIEDHPNTWEDEIKDIQIERKEEERRKAAEQEEKLHADEMELRCLNCDTFICFSSDLRRIQNNHNVAIEEEVKERVVSRRGPHPEFEENDLQFDGEVFCGKKDCQRKLGGVCTYKHTEFPLFSIKNFRVADKNGSCNRFKKWKDANFVPEPFTLEDLRDYVDRLRGRMD